MNTPTNEFYGSGAYDNELELSVIEGEADTPSLHRGNRRLSTAFLGVAAGALLMSCVSITSIHASASAVRPRAEVVDTVIKDDSVSPTTPERVWSSAHERLARFCRYGQGWDGGSASPIDSAVARNARHVLAAFSMYALPEPSVVPSPDGGIQIEWHTKGVDAELFVTARSFDAVITNARTGEETELDGLQHDDVSEAASKLIDAI